MDYPFSKEMLSVVFATGLEYDGWAILERLFHKDGGFWDEKDQRTMRLHPSRYYVRALLFGFQRYFCKWGGEFVPEYDRQFSYCYFTYLQAYRIDLPRCLIGPWHREANHDGYWLPSVSEKEAVASQLRRLLIHVTPWNHDVPDVDAMAAYGLDPQRQTPGSCPAKIKTAVLLSQSYDPVIPALSGNKQGLEDYKADFKPSEDVTSYAAGMLLRALQKGRFSDDEAENGMAFSILGTYLLRNKAEVEAGSLALAVFMLLYLHLYRTHIPSIVRREPYATGWEKVAFDVREEQAAKFRRTLSRFRERVARQAKVARA